MTIDTLARRRLALSQTDALGAVGRDVEVR